MLNLGTRARYSKGKALLQSLAAIAMLTLRIDALADFIISDDFIIQGQLCVGVDCVDGEVFGAATMRLKENNLRIRLIDTTVADVLGQSWNIDANSSANGAGSYMNFGLKSLTQSTGVLSDGNGLLYDCANMDPTLRNRIIGVTPAGEVLLTPQPVPSTSPTEYECADVPGFTEVAVFRIGASADNTQQLGAGSTAVSNAVSVGRADLLRKVVRVAEGIADFDAIVKKSLTDYRPLAVVEDQLAQLSAAVEAVENQLTALENSDSDNDGLGLLGEITYGTDPNDRDSDDDGLPDGLEVKFGRDPLVRDNALIPIIDSLLLDD